MDYVLGFALSKDKNKVLMIKKNRPSFQKGLMNGIGGKINPNEFSLDAMIREFQEETSLITKKDDWIYFEHISGNDFNIYCYYSFFEYDFLLKFQSLTDETVFLLDINEIKTQSFKNCVSDVKELLLKII